MIKKFLGTFVLLVLSGIVIFNFVEDQKEAETEDYSQKNTSSEGGAIAPVESAGLEPGEMAPNFTLQTLNGEEIQLSELKGKKVLLNFWATWCPPCKEEMPEMQTFHETYGDEVEVLAVNMTKTETSGQNDVKKFNEKFAYSYPMPLDIEGEISAAYNVFTVPTTYFIGTDGRIAMPRKSGPMTYEFMEESISNME
ncbi:TlpA family protein disulfide reductase [Oceanobacillus manasiensis]|uniref:TlpA family protein disulfide reductase n=1 Tax=Oceanobacillus manasiensis TaxID=586413 RepID=UPI0005A669D2|nr:TlpA disulfide reductase family protein [Oceanobacillus manasiensis]